MKKALEKLWDEYFAEECATMETTEEKTLTKKAIETHNLMNKLLKNDQVEIVEKYIDTLYEIQSLHIKKSFFCGCKFTASFIFEAIGLCK